MASHVRHSCTLIRTSSQTHPSHTHAPPTPTLTHARTHAHTHTALSYTLLGTHRVFFGIYQQQYTHTRAHIQTHTHAYTDAHLHARIPSNCSSGDSAVFPVPEVSDREGRRLDCLDCVANLGQTLGCPNHRACPHLWCDRMFPKREY